MRRGGLRARPEFCLVPKALPTSYFLTFLKLWPSEPWRRSHLESVPPRTHEIRIAGVLSVVLLY